MDMISNKVHGQEEIKLPSKNIVETVQYDLFTQFYGKVETYSNTIEMWDSVPKYFMSRQAQNKLRDTKGFLPLREYEFQLKGRNCKVVIQPAMVLLEGGGSKAFYPSSGEELIDDVLRKFFSDQRYGVYDHKEGNSWVQFSLQMIKKELKARGKTRSVKQIKDSIEILNRSNISLYVDGELIYGNAILSNITQVSRKKWTDEPSSRWVAQLPALVSKSINGVTYRQFNYVTMMSFKSQLARWLHKKLSHNYINAGLLNSYQILFSSVVRDSGLLPHKKTSHRVIAFENSLQELIDKSVLGGFSKEIRKGKFNSIVDILYIFHAHPAFIKEIKAANIRHSKALEVVKTA